MIDDDLLYRLAETPTLVQPRPLAEIAQRAKQLRIRRQAGRVGAAVLAVGLIGGLAVPLWPHQNESQTSPAEVRTKKVCRNNGDLVDAQFSKYPQLAYLPPRGIAPRLVHVPPTTAHGAEYRCPNPSAKGTWYAMAQDGTVAHKLIVRGPDYVKPSNEDFNSKPKALDQDGRSGVFQHLTTDRSQWSLPPEHYGWVWWTETDGSSWYAQQFGLTEAQMLTAVRSLTIDQGKLDPAKVPAGLSTTVPAYSGPTGDVQVEFQFGQDEERVSLITVQILDSSWQADAGTRPVTINGRPGWIKGGTGGEYVWLDWELAPGVVGLISGQVTQKRALAIARATEKISMNDPRLKRRQ
jgi:hypothetical protein